MPAVRHALQLPADLVELSFLFVLVGYGTKAGFAPCTPGCPMGMGEAPAPISALLSGVLLKSALYAILRFSTLTNAALGSSQFTSSLLLGTGLVSLLLATPFILNERNRFKRVLAYHSLEHMGIIAFGLGIGGPIALFGALLHTLNHALTKALMFLSFGTVAGRFTGPTSNQRTLSNVLMLMPALGLILAIGGLALVGMPPFNIFLSELIILWGSAETRRKWLAVHHHHVGGHPVHEFDDAHLFWAGPAFGRTPAHASNAANCSRRPGDGGRGICAIEAVPKGTCPSGRDDRARHRFGVDGVGSHWPPSLIRV
ncbi:MAG: hypothetical protein IPK16_27485 [Anaerolineales bacterium]|nr:hypothetical protein [Anaerolineales bacterium]